MRVSNRRLWGDSPPPEPCPPREGPLPYPLGTLTILASLANSLLLNSLPYQQGSPAWPSTPRAGCPHSATEYSLLDASNSGFLGSGSVAVVRGRPYG